MTRARIALLLAAGFGLAWPAAVFAQAQASSPRPWGNISFYTNAARVASDGGPQSTSDEFITAVRYELTDGEGNGLEYAVDARHAAYTRAGYGDRVSIYDLFVGGRMADGQFRLRGGQMWITDLGGLGAVAGALVEYRQPRPSSQPGRVRVGIFGGLEPDAYRLGFVHGVTKLGGYAVIEGAGARRHVLGYVHLGHSGLTERSVITITNFVPAKSRVFLFQSAEYDLTGPAGQGRGRLSYFFLNSRATLTSRVEVQGLYHRGRSIDTRSITDDVLAGRPVPASAVEGLLFSSAGGRVTVELAKRLRVNAGYTRDRNNRDSEPSSRITAGVSAMNIARTGFDVTVSDARNQMPTGRYDSLYVSIGRQVGRSLYLSGDYSSSLSVVQFTRSDGFVVDMRPHTRQYTGSAVVTLGRHVSLLVTADRVRDDTTSEFRLLSGLNYRFR